MSEIVFALPRTEYGSYSDLYQLIALNEYSIVYVDEIDPSSDDCYIIVVNNGEVANGWRGATARIILYDFEWRPDGMTPIPGVSEVWHMDRHTALNCGVRYVPLGGDARLKPRFESHNDWTLDYDTAYLGYMTYRRQHIHAQLLAREMRMPHTSAWGSERHAVLRRSKSYLHVHQLDNVPGVPALRLVVAAAYRMPVISEAFADAGIFEDMTMEADYNGLADAAHLWTHQYSNIQAYGDALHDLLCEEYTFKRCIEGHV